MGRALGSCRRPVETGRTGTLQRRSPTSDRAWTGTSHRKDSNQRPEKRKAKRRYSSYRASTSSSWEPGTATTFWEGQQLASQPSGQARARGRGRRRAVLRSKKCVCVAGAAAGQPSLQKSQKGGGVDRRSQFTHHTRNLIALLVYCSHRVRPSACCLPCQLLYVWLYSEARSYRSRRSWEEARTDVQWKKIEEGSSRIQIRDY
jgi:hypothetical protein